MGSGVFKKGARMEPSSVVLFVDNDGTYLETARQDLRDQGITWHIHTVSSAEEAGALLTQNRFDCVVADASVPESGGLGLLDHIRHNEVLHKLPVVILTQGDDLQQKRLALSEGATDLLSKPIQTEEFIARVSNALRLKKTQDDLLVQSSTLERRIQERTALLEETRAEVVWRLAKAGEYRDEETGNHILRVGLYCRKLALGLDLGEEQAELLYLTSPLHDIGKIGIPDAILLKKGKLTKVEWAVMQSHCEIGASILLRPAKNQMLDSQDDTPMNTGEHKLMRDPVVFAAALIARSHHERWDGKGYPRGLGGTDIPLSARITAVADVYDALRSARPYKAPFSHQKSMDIMHEGAGTQFDPRVFEAFDKLGTRFDGIFSELADF